MRARLLAATAALLALAGCRSASPESDAGDEGATPGRFTEAELAASFAAHDAILEGFDAPEAGDDGWRIGDRALYGIRLDDDSGEWASDRAQVWLVLATVASEPVPHGEPILFEAGPDKTPTTLVPKHTALTFTLNSGEKIERASGSIAIEVVVFDGSGAEIGRSHVGAPARFLQEGFHATLQRSRRWTDEKPATQAEGVEAFLTVVTSLMGFLETFHQSPALESLRTRIVDSTLAKPSIFSAIFGLDLSINPMITSILDESRPLAARREGDEALEFTTTLSLNGALGLALDFVVVEPAPPLRVVGGVIGFEACHPSRPQRKFAARLLAARRGPAPSPAAPESD